MKFKFAFVLALAVIFFSIPAQARKIIINIEDLKSANVGVQSETSSEALVRSFMSDSSGKIFTFEKIADVIQALKEQKIDAAVMDEAPARFFTIEEEGLKVLSQPVESELYAIAFRKNDSLREKVDNAIEQLKNNGTLGKILEKYIGDYPDPAEIDFNKGKNLPKLWVGCAASFPPYDMRSERGFYGIDIELCAEIAKILNMELVIADYRFEALFDALDDGKINMICSGLSITNERVKHFDFSQPYDANQQVVVTLSASQK